MAPNTQTLKVESIQNNLRSTRRLAPLTHASLLAAILLVGSSLKGSAQDIGEGGNNMGFDMAPETNLAVVEAAMRQIPVQMAPGPFEPSWVSLKQNYKVPDWFIGAKFGIFLHFGIFSVPAHQSEWYEKFMYAGGDDNTLKAMRNHDTLLPWHTAHFGPPDKFGYKDFIPMFKAEKFDADAWALLFKRAGARYVVPGAQHHENFAMWDSEVTPFNAMQMGPKRDVIGELAKAVRKQGMKLGLANHGIENFQFINPPPDLAARLKAEKVDLFDPKWADFYNYADRSDAACQKFLVNWYERNVELIDKYHPDLLYFDNGIDQRYLDPLKLSIAAYYYNRAKSWGKEVSLTTKKAAFSPTDKNTETIGSIIDFEGRTPKGIRTGSWQEDQPVGSSWGYVTGMRINSSDVVISWLVEAVSKNGSLLLNVSPMADGTIPQEQQNTLLGVGKWLETNGEAIYDTHSWIKFEETGKQHTYFTVKGDVLYAILSGKAHGSHLIITSLAQGQAPSGTITSVTMLGGGKKPLSFSQDSMGLKVKLPASARADGIYTLKITGLKMNPPTWTVSGDPMQGNGVAAK
jgi:alpha-L-fucosidase